MSKFRARIAAALVASAFAGALPLTAAAQATDPAAAPASSKEELLQRVRAVRQG